MPPVLAYCTTAPASLVFMLMLVGWSLPYSQFVNCGTMMMTSATIMSRTASTLKCALLCLRAAATPLAHLLSDCMVASLRVHARQWR